MSKSRSTFSICVVASIQEQPHLNVSHLIQSPNQNCYAITNFLGFNKNKHRNVQRLRGGLVFKAHRLSVSLNSRLESNQEEGDLRGVA